MRANVYEWFLFWWCQQIISKTTSFQFSIIIKQYKWKSQKLFIKFLLLKNIRWKTHATAFFLRIRSYFWNWEFPLLIIIDIALYMPAIVYVRTYVFVTWSKRFYEWNSPLLPPHRNTTPHVSKCSILHYCQSDDRCCVCLRTLNERAMFIEHVVNCIKHFHHHRHQQTTTPRVCKRVFTLNHSPYFSLYLSLPSYTWSHSS